MSGLNYTKDTLAHQLIGQILNLTHCVKYSNFTKFYGVETLWKGTFSVLNFLGNTYICYKAVVIHIV